MGKFFLKLMVLIVSVASCGTTRYAPQRTVDAMDEVSYVLANYYPQLFTYYEEGVLRVTSIKEITLADGTLDYNVKYRFVKYYYNTHAERMEIVKAMYPELYQMYLNGVIDINSVYKYVNRNTGRISYKVSYSRIYDYYHYYYSPGYIHRSRPYYRPPRYSPPPRIRPDHRPTPPPANRPPQRPNVRPGNNPPRTQPGNAGGGNQGGTTSRPQRTGGGRR